jgi:hypothetical protein
MRGIPRTLEAEIRVTDPHPLEGETDMGFNALNGHGLGFSVEGRVD